MTALGFDFSLTSTGVAGPTWTERIQPKKLSSWERLRYICDGVREYVTTFTPTLVVVEGPSYNSQGGHQHERGGLWWMATEIIDSQAIGIASAPPSNIKKYATGVGGGPKAGKDFVMLAAARSFSWFDGGNDEADALWACAMGYDHLEQPLVKMPALNRTALEKVDWP